MQRIGYIVLGAGESSLTFQISRLLFLLGHCLDLANPAALDEDLESRQSFVRKLTGIGKEQPYLAVVWMQGLRLNNLVGI
jgi:hypothetical protein